jgi:TatD DNase family protein
MNQNAEHVQVASLKRSTKGTFLNTWEFEACTCMQFVNVHTHKPSVSNGLEIINLVVGHDPTDNLPSKRLYSAGIHPWYTENLEKSKETLTHCSTLPNISAIGECGFDSKSPLPFPNQELLFIYHVELSEKLEKPLIIHSIKSINEVIRIKKELKPCMPWIIHGFNANKQTADECIKHGLLLSIGHQICNRESSIAKIIDQIPLTSLFFETDESDLPVEAIYEQYSLLTGKPLNDVCESIYANFARYFLKKRLK